LGGVEFGKKKIAKPCFMWNIHAAENLSPNGQTRENWVLKIMHGFYGQSQCEILANTIEIH
jgi:hypothetical protein